MMTVMSSVIATLFAVAIIFFVKSRFGTQPKVRVRLLPSLTSSSGGRQGKIKISWRKKIELYNLTGFPALELSFHWPDSSRKLNLPDPEPMHLNPTDTQAYEIEIVKEFTSDELGASHDRFTRLLPEELRCFVLIVRYKNDKEVTFYSRYEQSGDDSTCTYHKIKPKK
jgi:hypothetical protein